MLGSLHQRRPGFQGSPGPMLAENLSACEQEPSAVRVEDAHRDDVLEGEWQNLSPASRRPQVCKALDTGWLLQPGWETGKNRRSLPPSVGSMSGRLPVLYSPNKLGKGALLPQCKEGEPGACGGRCLSTSPLLPVHGSLSTCSELVLTLVSPDLTHLCSPGGLRRSVQFSRQLYS